MFSDSKVLNDKYKRLYEIENEKKKLRANLSNTLEKIADSKVKLADRVGVLSEEAYVELAVKDRIYNDLMNKIKKLRSKSDKGFLRELDDLKGKLKKAEMERNVAKQRSDMLTRSTEKFKLAADIALRKAQESSESSI